MSYSSSSRQSEKCRRTNSRTDLLAASASPTAATDREKRLVSPSPMSHLEASRSSTTVQQWWRRRYHDTERGENWRSQVGTAAQGKACRQEERRRLGRGSSTQKQDFQEEQDFRKENDKDNESSNKWGGGQRRGRHLVLGDDDKPFQVGYSPTSRYTCRRCDKRLEKGTLRVSRIRHLHRAAFAERVTDVQHVGGRRQLHKQKHRCAVEIQMAESLIEPKEEKEVVRTDALGHSTHWLRIMRFIRLVIPP